MYCATFESESYSLLSPSVRAKFLARSLFRLMIIVRAPLAIRCFAASSAISPAPTITATMPFNVPKISFALATATLETEIGFLEISVLFRTSAAHLKANSIALPSFAPHLPLARANLYASFSCPAICVSPITRLSSELATAKRWCTAPLSS